MGAFGLNMYFIQTLNVFILYACMKIDRLARSTCLQVTCFRSEGFKGCEGGWHGRGLIRLLAKVAALAACNDDTLRCQNRPRPCQPPSQPLIEVRVSFLATK